MGDRFKHLRASQGYRSRQGQGDSLGPWIPGCAMLSHRRIEAPVPASQWDFGTSGAEDQEESRVDKSREGKKKNKDRLEKLVANLWERKAKESRKGKMNNTQDAKGKAQRVGPFSDSGTLPWLSLTIPKDLTMSLPLRTSGLSKTQRVLCMVLTA